MIYGKLLEFFPPPKFLEMPALGLSFSDRALRAVRLSGRGHSLKLEKYGYRALPADTIKEAYINNKGPIIDALRSLREEFGYDFVNVSVPEEKAYLFKTEIPKAAVGNIRETIELRLEENVPLPVGEAIFDYSLITSNETKDHLDASVTVLPIKMVEVYLEVIKSAGFKPLSLNLESQSVSRSVIPRGNLDTIMVVNVGETRTCLSVINRGVVQFNLTIPIGGETMTLAVAKHFSVGDKEAKEIKSRFGFSKSRGNSELFFALTNTVSAIKDEINKLNIYWQTHRNPHGSSERNIQKIILCGKDADLEGFDEYITAVSKIEAVVADVWQNVFSYDEFIPAIQFNDSLDYASAIGSALQD